MTEPRLPALQAWFQARVLAGPRKPADGVDAATMVVSSATLSADDRLAVYARSYVQRLAECMRTEFPILRSLIGEQVFNLFVGGYLSARPSTSYSLYDLGAGFADYLEATRPKPHTGPGTPEALPASLARLERASAETERAAGVERDANPAASVDVIALLHDPGARLQTPPALKLLRLDFDFTETLAGSRDGDRPPLPAARETFVAVARSRYRLRAHTLEPWAFAWLGALRQTGGDVHAASQAAARASGRDGGAIFANLLVWLPVAVAAGFVQPWPE